MEYIKLKDLVNDQFTVEKVVGVKWVMWNDAESKYERSDTPQKGYTKQYLAQTNKGALNVSQSQMAQMLEAASDLGKADVIEKKFEVRSNGKDGKEIRYYINLAKPVEQTEDAEDILAMFEG